MKKGLSILLIAAALFGFYGGATSLNDVLASKDYWEKVGEQSTADMNKLEDGLHQLGDNEQAYLDGKAQIADGEALLAEKEAEFAAAPGKLREGEETLAEGYEDFNKLKTLISGLREARKHGVATTAKHNTYWHDGYSYSGTKANQYMDGGLRTTRGVITKLMAEQQANGTLGLIEGIAQVSGLNDGIQSATSYASFDKALLNVSKAFGVTEKYLSDKATAARTPSDISKIVEFANSDVPDTGGTVQFGSLPISDIMGNDQLPALVRGGVKAIYDNVLEVKANIPAIGGLEKMYKQGSMPTTGALVAATAVLDTKGPDDLTLNELLGVAQAVGAKSADMADIFDFGAKTVGGYKDNMDKWDAGYNTLVDGKATLASTSEGIPYAFKNMVTNSTIKAAIKQYDPKLMSILKKYKGNRLKNEQFGDAFDSDLVYLSKNVIPRCLKVLAKVRSSAAQQLADGEKQLAEGKAAYAAAPAQLEAGRQTLADGKKQLAQYEDGEQQVRDGLATLMATEPDGGLESILDRRNGDDQFDDENGHLDINEGLDAVEVGRGYQAESGELITKEITGRAVGTAAGLGAAVLAVLAAILSFAKKYKGAAVSAILAAVAGCAGALVGNNAGDEFSNIAGSTVGATPWIAAGVLAAVALVFAIAHFTTKPEA